MPTWIIFLVILSVLVLIHELGHFLAAKFFNIRVEEFALGLPYTKALWQIRFGETVYSIYPLLFGGFVRLHGEESEEKIDKSRAFWSRSRRQRLIVVAAGVAMNIVLAFILLAGVYAGLGVPTKNIYKVTVISVEPGSPAEKAGLKIDDRIVAVEDKSVANGAELGKLMRSWAGVPVNVSLESGPGTYLLEGILQGQISSRTVSVTGRLNPPEGQGPLGVGLADYPYLEAQKDSRKIVSYALKNMFSWMGRVFDGLRQIGSSLSRGKAPEGLSGPVGIYQLTDAVSRGGFWPLVELTAVLSVNLGVLNILPIPALDGGRAFFIILEFIRRKRISPELEQKINGWGMTILLILIGLITAKDLLGLKIFSFLTKYLPN